MPVDKAPEFLVKLKTDDPKEFLRVAFYFEGLDAEEEVEEEKEEDKYFKEHPSEIPS